MGVLGTALPKQWSKKDARVLAIDKDEERIQAISDIATFAVQCDATDERALKAVSAQNVDVAVVSIGENIEASILIVQTLKEMGVKSIVAKAVAPIQGKILKNLGVDEVIYPERDAAIRLAHRLVSPGVIEYLELSPGYSVEEVAVSDTLSGLSLEEIKMRGQHNLNIIGIKQQVSRMVKGRIMTEETFNFTPKPDDVVEKGDVLVMIGQEKDLDRFCNDV